MRDARGERADSREAVGHAQLRLRFAQGVLGALALGHVEEGDDASDELALPEHRRRRMLHRNHRPVVAHELQLLIESRVTAHRRVDPHRWQRVFHSGKTRHGIEGAAEKLLGRGKAEDAKRRRVAEGDQALEVEAADRLHGRVEEEAHAIFALARLLPCLPRSLRHLHEDADLPATTRLQPREQTADDEDERRVQAGRRHQRA